MLIGRLGPRKLKHVPLTVACVMVMVALLPFVTTTGTELVLPTWTLPKFRLEVEEVICPKTGIEDRTTMMRNNLQFLFRERRQPIALLFLRALDEHSGG